MTNGIVLVIKEGAVCLKIVAGCDGYNAPNLAHLLRMECMVPHMETVYNFALSVGFGCRDCLVVQSPETDLFKGEDELDPLYRDHFHDPQFNPRWERGTCGHIEVVNLK